MNQSFHFNFHLYHELLLETRNISANPAILCSIKQTVSTHLVHQRPASEVSALWMFSKLKDQLLLRHLLRLEESNMAGNWKDKYCYITKTKFPKSLLSSCSVNRQLKQTFTTQTLSFSWSFVTKKQNRNSVHCRLFQCSVPEHWLFLFKIYCQKKIIWLVKQKTTELLAVSFGQCAL